MSGNTDFGFELLNQLYGEQIGKKEDVLILLIHWYLIKNGFKCIGLGDSKTVSSTETGSELLPREWNKETVYKLRYLKDSKLHIIIGIKSDNELLINFMKVDDTVSSSLLLSTENIVKQLHGSLETLVPNYSEIIDKIKNELVEPVYSSDSKSTSTQTTADSRNTREGDSDDPLRVPRPEHRVPTRSGIDDFDPLRRVGQGDLDPLGRMGGGMLFDPLHRGNFNPAGSGVFSGIPSRLPPGAVPPGARFDPLGLPRAPPSAYPRRNPDNDHLPPPGYDDMFM